MSEWPPKCEDCKYLNQERPWQCRRHAPITEPGKESTYKKFPFVHQLSDWCGDFEPLPAPPEAE